MDNIFSKTKVVIIAVVMLLVSFAFAADAQTRSPQQGFFAQVIDRVGNFFQNLPLPGRGASPGSAIDGRAIRARNSQIAPPALSQETLHINAPGVFRNGFTSEAAATFSGNVTVRGALRGTTVNLGAGTITASNVLYGLAPGAGVLLTGDPQRPTISFENLFEQAQNTIRTKEVLSFQIGDILRAEIDRGRVGIGTTSPLARLTIENRESTTTGLLLFAAKNQTASVFDIKDHAQKSIITLAPPVEGQIPAAHTLTVDANLVTKKVALFEATSTFIAPIQASSSAYFALSGGRVGVGTNNPTENLSVAGSLGVSGKVKIPLLSCSDGSVLETDAEGNISCGFDDIGTSRGGGTGVVNSGDGGSLAVYSGSRSIEGANNLVFKSSNLGIGTSSPGITLTAVGSGYMTGGLGVGIATSTAGVIQTTGVVVVGGTGTSTFTNGIVLTGGCFRLPDGNCAGAGGGTITSGTTNRLSYYSAATTLDSANFLTVDATNSNLGISTTSPANKLSIVGGAYFDSSIISYASTSATTLTFDYGLVSPTSTIRSNIFNAWSIATSTSVRPILSVGSSGGLPRIGIGTSTPFASLSIEGMPGQAMLAVGSSTQTNVIVDNSGYLGVATSIPRFPLSVYGNAMFDSGTLTLGTSTGALTVSYQSQATSTVKNLQTYAWTIATSTTAQPIFSVTTNAPRSSTTVLGSFVVDGGALSYDANSGTTSIDMLQLGPSAFESDAGILSWVDMPVLNTTADIIMSYSAQLDTNPILTIFGRTDSVGGVGTTSVAIGTTTGAWLLHVASTTPFIGITDTNAGANLKHWTISSQSGSLFVATSSDLYATSSLPAFLLGSDTRAGFGTATPYALLSVNAIPGYAQFVVGSSTATNFIIDRSGYTGVATSVPRMPFSVVGDTYLNSGTLTLASSTGALTVAYQSAATSTVPTSNAYAWTIATTTTAQPIFSVNTRSSFATSTFRGGFVITPGDQSPIPEFEYDYSSNLTTIGNLQIGESYFEADSGIVTWTDMPVATTATSTIMSYTARLDGNPLLTVYGWAAGSGIVGTTTVGIGTTTPAWKLQVSNTATSTTKAFVALSDNLAGANLKHWTMSSQGGNFYIATSSDLYATSTASVVTLLSNTRVGIGTASPYALLSVNAIPGHAHFSVGSSTNSSFMVDELGNTNVGTSTSGTVAFQQNLKVANGAICADNNGGAKCLTTLTAGTVYGDASSFAASDLAENYPVTDSSIEAGEIVMVSDISSEEKRKRQEEIAALRLKQKDSSLTTVEEMLSVTLEKATKAGGQRTIGVISTKPGMLLGDTTGLSFNTLLRPVALSGRVPIKVSSEGGAVKAGDYITVSSLAGIGMKAEKSGITVGIALEDYDFSLATTSMAFAGSEVKIGKTLVFVNLGYSRLDDNLSGLVTNNQLPPTNAWSVEQRSGKVNVGFFGMVDMHGEDIINVGRVLSDNGRWKIQGDGTIVAEEVQAKRGLFEESLEVGKEGKPTGITLYDSDTGGPYCIRIVAGAMQSIPGKCGSAPAPAPSSPEPVAPETLPEETPPVEEPAPIIENEPAPAEEPPAAEEVATSTPE